MVTQIFSATLNTFLYDFSITNTRLERDKKKKKKKSVTSYHAHKIAYVIADPQSGAVTIKVTTVLITQH